MKNDDSYERYVSQFGTTASRLVSMRKLQDNVKCNCTFDYFKCAFYWDWLSGNPEDVNMSVKLFSLLHLDKSAFDVVRGDVNFGSRLIYNGDTFLMFHPLGKLPCGVSEYFMVELTGSACRSFELRGGCWLDLFEFINSVSHKVTRIDLALDDMVGVIPLDDVGSVKGIKSRCRDMLFTSNFRQRKSVRLGMINYDVEAVEADDGFDVPLTNDNPKGWSFTLGKVNSIQLQIYDKLKERLAKGVHTNLDSWVRFEMRFGSIGDRGETVFRLSLLALQNKCFGVLCSQLLRWLIDFRDTDKVFSSRNMDKVSSWKPYDFFLGGVSGNSLPINQGRAEASVITSVSWIMNQWAKTAVTLCKVSRKYMLSVMANAMCRFINSKQGEGCRNSLNGVVSTFYLMFPDVLGKFDEKKSDDEVKAFIQDFGTGVVDDSEDGSDNGIFSWNKY